MDNYGPAADLSGDESDQLLVGVNFRSDGVDDAVVVLVASFHGYLGHVLHIDRLKPVVPRSRYGEHGGPTKEPGDVVDKDIRFTEDHRGPDDSVGEAGVDYGGFQQPFPGEVRKG